MSNIYSSADGMIGHTPLLELNNIKKSHGFSARLLAKIEFLNPAGSVKDRVAKNMLDSLEKDGKIGSETVIIEPTSGNTGIGLASVCAARGYKCVIVMPENMSEERKKLISAYGASLVLTDGEKGMAGAIEKAEEIKNNTPNSVIAGQFVNPANPESHFNTTGPEIFEDTDGKVDIFVCGVGTGGTISGTGKYLKEKNPNIKVIAVEPADSPVLSKGISGKHGIQGIGAGFVPQTLDTAVYDEIITVSQQEAYAAAREMGKKEGVLTGISSGAALHGALQVACRKENEGKTIVVLLPDGGERYLSTDLY